MTTTTAAITTTTTTGAATTTTSTTTSTTAATGSTAETSWTTMTTTVTSAAFNNMSNGTNSTGGENEWKFLLSAFFILLAATGFCGGIIMVCKSQTRVARRRREEEANEKDQARKALKQELMKQADERDHQRTELEDKIQRELEEQEEIEQARKEGRDVDPVYTRDDIFYATVSDVPTFQEHPSSYVESGTAALDHKGAPKPRAGDKNFSKVKSTDADIGMVNEKQKQLPVVMGMKVIGGVDFYRNQYERTVAQQEARAQADAAVEARKNSQPYSYRKKQKRETVSLGEDFASSMEKGAGGGAGGEAGAAATAISKLPWLGKQNLSAFDADAFEKAFDALPDDDEQEEIDRRKRASAQDASQTVHGRVTGQVLAEGIGLSRTAGGGGAAKMSLLEAPSTRKAREQAEATARQLDAIEQAKYAKALEDAKKPKKKGQTKVVPPAQPPVAQAQKLVVAPHLERDKDKDAYYAELL